MVLRKSLKDFFSPACEGGSDTNKDIINKEEDARRSSMFSCERLRPRAQAPGFT
jgi:hypothetical protein